MLLIYPDKATLDQGHQKPTKGEYELLRFLYDNLDNSFELYFQPYLNGDRPDIILMKKNHGLIIFEVKDWDFSHYELDDRTNWIVRTVKGKFQIKSPFNQVFSYKKNLFEIHSKQLLAQQINNPNLFRKVACCVFFSNSLYSEYVETCVSPFNNKNYNSYRKFLSYFGVITKDTLTSEKLNSIITKFGFNVRDNNFTEPLYISMRRLLKPPYHYIEEGKKIIYTKEQTLLIESRQIRQKIKGAAGSGKTYVLAKRAVNSYLRTGKPVLILTYNLSLVNYIKDRINDVRQNFPWDKFFIINYHQFFKQNSNNCGLKINSIQDFDNPRFFELQKDQINKFHHVFIDEVQDYREEWLDLINSYFVHEDAEFVVFGDEKQNIYDRELDEEKTPKTKGITGRWNKTLTKSLRFNGNIAKIAALFQENFFKTKYNLDTYEEIYNRELDFEKGVQKYFYIEEYLSPELMYDDVLEPIFEANNIHPSDICILSSEVEYLRGLDFYIRTSTKHKTTCMFENQESYNKLLDKLKKGEISKESFTNQIEKMRRQKKIYFFMKTGLIKLCTVHSFKGWDINTLILIINKEEQGKEIENNYELIYTAITRAKKNLFIINNFGNTRVNSFFKSVGITDTIKKYDLPF